MGDSIGDSFDIRTDAFWTHGRVTVRLSEGILMRDVSHIIYDSGRAYLKKEGALRVPLHKGFLGTMLNMSNAIKEGDELEVLVFGNTPPKRDYVLRLCQYLSSYRPPRQTPFLSEKERRLLSFT